MGHFILRQTKKLNFEPYISDFNYILKINSPEKTKSNKKKLAQSDKQFSRYRALKN